MKKAYQITFRAGGSRIKWVRFADNLIDFIESAKYAIRKKYDNYQILNYGPVKVKNGTDMSKE